MKQKTLKEIKLQYETLKKNFEFIKNKSAREKVLVEINTLKEVLDNPNINLDGQIDLATGERKKTLKWIAGKLV